MPEVMTSRFGAVSSSASRKRAQGGEMVLVEVVHLTRARKNGNPAQRQARQRHQHCLICSASSRLTGSSLCRAGGKPSCGLAGSRATPEQPAQGLENPRAGRRLQIALPLHRMRTRRRGGRKKGNLGDAPTDRTDRRYKSQSASEGTVSEARDTAMPLPARGRRRTSRRWGRP